MALYAHKSLVRIRAGIATSTHEGVSAEEVKAKVRQQVRAKLEEQVHPIHAPPQTSRANCGAGSRKQGGGRKVGKIPEGPGQKQSREAAGE